ncbi:MAG: alpha/beta fold hydrolase [Phycisphaerales bacterium]|nr:alpha/beta fold hydrolase [Planctomycetota bacterium]MCH8508843.1 alpha/beta fold hydrolase [Phycisphaerales bacterium]
MLPIVYVLAAVVSSIVSNTATPLPRDDRSSNKRSVPVTLRGAAGDADPLETLGIAVEIDQPESAPASPGPPPVLLIHGSPGSSENFDRLAPLLAERGRTVIRPDLAGFGDSSHGPDLSYPVQAEYMLEMLSALEVERAHVVGWSNGGGVGIWMAHAAPHRVASLTLLASVGAQETEGSGSYAFEQFKYKLGRVVLGYGVELLPHFGLLGSFRSRTAWLKNFDDSDQREMTTILPTLTTPTLILHGRGDFLVPAWAAEAHHRLIPTSRLVMLDASHFLPILQPEETAAYLSEHIERHDRRGAPALTTTVDLAPLPDRGPTSRTLHSLAWGVRHIPWFIAVPVFALIARYRPLTGIILAGVLVATGFVDFGVAGLGVVVGRVWWAARSGPLDRPASPGGWLALTGWTMLAFLLAWLGVGSVTVAWTDSVGVPGLVGGVILGLALLVLARFVWSRTGRQRLRACVRRMLRHEYWPAWMHYLPVLVCLPVWIVRARGRPVFTAVNPGYARDGGVVAERKHEILDRLRDPAVLPGRLIDPDPDPDRRADGADRLVRTTPELGGYPAVCKPDRGERGRSVRIVDDAEELRSYLRQHAEPVLIQRYDPGPVEVGVLWIRDPTTLRDPQRPGLHGRIYAVTRKVLPTVIGDGSSTLRELVLAHRRHSAQAGVFLERLAGRLDEVPPDGTVVPIGSAANHAQGAEFADGSDLATPELEARIDAMARAFEGGFDIGRFDIRCPSEEALMRGQDLRIIELNGVTSEPTNIYDPSWSIFRAQRVLLGYWSRLFELGMARQQSGTGASVRWSRLAAYVIGWKIRSRRRRVAC